MSAARRVQAVSTSAQSLENESSGLRVKAISPERPPRLCTSHAVSPSTQAGSASQATGRTDPGASEIMPQLEAIPMIERRRSSSGVASSARVDVCTSTEPGEVRVTSLCSTQLVARGPQ